MHGQGSLAHAGHAADRVNAHDSTTGRARQQPAERFLAPGKRRDVARQRPRHARRPARKHGVEPAVGAIRTPCCGRGRSDQLAAARDRLELLAGRPGKPEGVSKQLRGLFPRGVVDPPLKIAYRSGAEHRPFGQPS